MKKVLFFIIINFICSLIVLYINISRIPVGDELGAIVEMFLSLFFGALIFSATFGLSVLLNNLLKRNQIYIQLLIHATCVFLVYYSSYRVCVYREPHIKPEEMRAIRLEQIEKTKEKVEKIISKAVIYKPENFVVENDKKQIKEAVKNFFNKSYIDIKSNRAFKDSIYNLLDSNISVLDSVETNSFFSTVYNSIDLDLILYSPDLKKILVFFSFDETFTINPGRIESGANAFALIGLKSNCSIKLYRFYYESYSSVNNPNKESAYYQLFLFLTNNSRYSSMKYPINKKEFWRCEYVFGTENIDNQILYGFQIDKGGNTKNTPEFLNYDTKKHKIKEPLFIIQN